MNVTISNGISTFHQNYTTVHPAVIWVPIMTEMKLCVVLLAVSNCLMSE